MGIQPVLADEDFKELIRDSLKSGLKIMVDKFEKLENEHTAHQLQITVDDHLQSESDKNRQQKWKPLLIMAQNNKKKLQQQININQNDVKQIEQIFETIEAKENELAQTYINSNTCFNYPINDNVIHRKINSQPIPIPATDNLINDIIHKLLQE